MRLDFPLTDSSRVLGASGKSIVFPPGAIAVLPVIGPDFESRAAVDIVPESPETSTLTPTLSHVIDPAPMSRLPLPSRDVYTLLITLPGVTTETATGRGLGLSVNGQRPSSANFLLDGMENNDYLTTGPFTTIAPESTREYRISVNNFSAEFGGSAGVLANAVTRSGSNSFHGLGYAYLNNDVLNANSFQSNAVGNTRPPRKELYAGFHAGGPIRKDALFISSSYERLRSRTRRDPIDVQVPLLPRFRAYYPNSAARRLLEQHPPPEAPLPAVPLNREPFELAGNYKLAEPVSLDRSLGLARLDRIWRSAGQRFFARAVVSDLTQPDFVYSIYPGFSSPLYNSSVNVAAAYIRQLWTNVTSEFRFGFRGGEIGFTRPNSNLPTLNVESGIVRLPGSEQPTEFRNRDRIFETGDTSVISWRSHVITAGAGFLMRRPETRFAFQRDGRYAFSNLLAFAEDQPSEFRVTLNRSGIQQTGEQSRFDRARENRSYFGFVQDSWRVRRGLAITIGLRYENFGTLRNRSVPDAYIQPGSGTSVLERMRGASRVVDMAHQDLFQSDANNWAPRVGVAYHLGRRTVARGAFGMFYDRPFDNLVLAAVLNNLQTVTFKPSRVVSEFERPLPTTLASFSDPSGSFDLPALWLEQGLRSPRVDTWFASLEQEISTSSVVQVSYRGAISRNLFVTDDVNRVIYEKSSRINTEFDTVRYRYNGGSSDYHALGAMVRYRGARGGVQFSYTLAHSIDTQSEPLRGEFSNLSYARGQQDTVGSAAFTRLGDAEADRGNSDYDQRHNLVVLSAWDLPSLTEIRWLRRLTSNWQFAQLAAFRSGFPYHAYANVQRPTSGIELLRNRASLVPGTSPILSKPTDVPGGKQLLDVNAFTDPPPGEIGNLGRNSLRGPSFWNIDVSIGRTFPVPMAPESVRLQFRADIFNIFNHANLGNPVGLRNDAFGQAFYGRLGTESPLRIIPPANETPRQIQLQVRVSF
jgi:hypothetical protein